MSEKVYKICKILSKISIWPGVLLGRIRRNNRYITDYMIPLSESVEEKSDVYVCAKFIPKKAEKSNICLKNEIKIDYSNCAIVIQGPIKWENSFTKETILWYQKIYPGIQVVLSIWNNENSILINKIKDETNCKIVISEPPTFLDNYNINRQIKSSLAGLEEAKRCGVSYVLKTRTDFRMLRTDFIDELIEKIEKHPVIDKWNIQQKYRIIVFKTGLFQPLYMPDFFNFGHVDDMIDFWNHPIMHTNVLEGSVRSSGYTYKEVFEKRGVPEIEFGYSYFERKGHNVKCDIEWWWDALKYYFIALSASESDYFWYKYHRTRDISYQHDVYYRDSECRNNLCKYTCDYQIWKAIYENRFMRNPKVDQYLVDEEF